MMELELWKQANPSQDIGLSNPVTGCFPVLEIGQKSSRNLEHVCNHFQKIVFNVQIFEVSYEQTTKLTGSESCQRFEHPG